MAGELDFAGLCELEPGLRELEEAVRAGRDDGALSFFCSNFEWLPLDGRLKSLVGTDRRRFHPMKGEPEVLHHSQAYEVAYLHLSRLMPPCRSCGCRFFEPFQDEQVEDSRRQALSRDARGESRGPAADGGPGSEPSPVS